MKNHYQVLDLDRSATSKEIKVKSQNLLDQIKSSNTSNLEKDKLRKKVLESYKFLTDYHQRKSLDDYLDKKNSNYKIINNKEVNPDNNSIITPLNLIDLMFNDMEKSLSNKSNTGNMFVKTYSSRIKPDKNGNLIEEVVETTNNNGKKNEKKYKNIYKDSKIDSKQDNKNTNKFLNWF